MMRSFKFQSALLTALSAAMLVAYDATSARAQGTESPAPIDCAQAGSMIDHAMKAPPPAMTGTIDHDALAAMQMHASMAMQMLNVEIACGKDSKKQAASQQLRNDTLDLINRIQRLSSPN